MNIVENRPVQDDPQQYGAESGFARARRAMIDSQLRPSGVSAPAVVSRMAKVAREDFVPQNAKPVAYMDRSIPLANGHRLPAPIVQGMMLQEADPAFEDKALLVDCGSGYMAELLRPMVGKLEVVSPEEAAAASRKKGDFTLLVIDGAVEQLPDTLAKRLSDDGRVVTGLLRNGLTRLAVGRKAGGDVALAPLAELGIPVLAEFTKPKEWTF